MAKPVGRQRATLSIIIPTLNEENHVGGLLECLAGQSYRNWEAVIVDGDSRDKTANIVRQFAKSHKNVKLVVEKKHSVGRARNVGAKHASGEYLLFLDADTLFKKNFLSRCMSEFDERFLDIATVCFEPLSKRVLHKLYIDGENTLVKIGQYIAPAAQGVCIFVTKRLFSRVGGFDRTIWLGEDVNFVERASKLGKFRVMKSAKIKVSMRRLDKEGIRKLLAKYLLCNIYRAFIGEVRTDIFNYQFGDYNHKKKEKELQRILQKLNRKFIGRHMKTVVSLIKKLNAPVKKI